MKDKHGHVVVSAVCRKRNSNSSIIEIRTLCVGEKRLLKSYSCKSDLFMALMFSGHLSNVRCPGRGHDFT